MNSKLARDRSGLSWNSSYVYSHTRKVQNGWFIRLTRRRPDGKCYLHLGEPAKWHIQMRIHLKKVCTISPLAPRRKVGRYSNRSHSISLLLELRYKLLKFFIAHASENTFEKLSKSAIFRKIFRKIFGIPKPTIVFFHDSFSAGYGRAA